MGETKTIDNTGVKINTLKYIKNFITIQTKESEVIPFTPNKAQMRLYEMIKKQYMEKRPIRIIVLKARQLGISTFIESVLFKGTATEFNVKTGIITHEDKATKNLFTMSKGFLNRLPQELKPQIQASNAQELVFNTKDGKGLNSLYSCMTATNEGVGRSSTFHNVHMSEIAFWKGNINEIYISLMSAVPDTLNSMVFIESTANGYNEFKTMWDNAVSGESIFEPLFIAWHEMDEYRKYYDGFEFNQAEIELKKRYNLDNEQIAWRRNKIKELNNDVNYFNQEFPSSPEDAFIATGNCVFDSNLINQRLKEIKPAIKRGYFTYKEEGNSLTNIEWKEDKKGYIQIYEDVKEGKPYVLGGDTAGEGSDYFIAQVLDNITGKQVAVLRKGFDEGQYARQMYCLGKYYNFGLLGIETNYGTYAQIRLSEDYKYPKLYVREQEDTFTQKIDKKYGFRTTTITRPIILEQLIDLMNTRLDLINDYTTLTEMLTFVRNEKGKAEAIVGGHDDTVMALAIAYYLRSSGQQKMKIDVAKQKETIDGWIQRSIKESKKQNKEAIMEW